MLIKQNQQQNNSTSSTSKLQTKRSQNLDKLIFDFDDFQQIQSHDVDQDKADLNQNTNKLQKLKNIKINYNSKIVPSLMRFNQQGDIYTYEKENQKMSNKIVNSNAKKFDNFVIFDINKKQTIKKIQQQPQAKLQLQLHQKTKIAIKQVQKRKPKSSRSQISYTSINPEKIEHLQQKSSDWTKNNNKLQQLLQESANIMIQSTVSEPNLSLNQIKHNKKQQFRRRSQFLFQIDTDSENRQQQVQSINEQQISEAITCVEQQLGQIVYTSQRINTVSCQLASKLSKFQDIHNIRIFLSTPIPQNILFNFQIHKYKNFMKTQYLLWLQHDDTMTLFAKAINDKVYIQKTVFRMTICPPGKQTHEKQQLFIGQLVSDFKRESYTLYDHKNYSNPRQNDKILSSIITVPNFINAKLKSQQLYIPKIIDKTPYPIYNNKSTKNKTLKKICKIPTYQSRIQKYTTHKVPQHIIQKFREQFKIASNTTRNAIVKNQKTIKFLFFKMQENRFKIRAGSGITPIQLLSYAVAHLQ